MRSEALVQCDPRASIQCDPQPVPVYNHKPSGGTLSNRVAGAAEDLFQSMGISPDAMKLIQRLQAAPHPPSSGGGGGHHHASRRGAKPAGLSRNQGGGSLLARMGRH